MTQISKYLQVLFLYLLNNCFSASQCRLARVRGGTRQTATKSHYSDLFAFFFNEEFPKMRELQKLNITETQEQRMKKEGNVYLLVPLLVFVCVPCENKHLS